MIQPFLINARRSLYRLLSLQALVAIMLAVVFWLKDGLIGGHSALSGGVICILSNGYVGYKLFAKSGARQTVQIVKAFYWAEAVKYMMVIALFMVAIRFFHVQALPFLVSFFICQMVFWIAPFIFN